MRSRLSFPSVRLRWPFAAIAVAWGLTVAAVGAQQPAPIFTAVSAQARAGLASPSASAQPDQVVLRSRLVYLNPSALDAALTAPGHRLLLNLFDDATYGGELERIEEGGLGHTSWVGHVAGRPLSTITLTRKGDIVSGLLSDGESSYQVTALGGGLHRVDQIDLQESAGRELPPLRAPDMARSQPLAGAALAHPQVTPIVDVLVFYTSALRQRIGAPTAQARIAQAVTDANTAYQRSGINGQLRLVGTSELGVADPMDPETGLAEFRQNPTVTAQRNAAGADIAVLVVNQFTNDGVCGIGYIGPTNSYAFSALADGCISNYTFTHEVGHNFGAEHARQDYDPAWPPQPWRPYVFGYKRPGFFRTVMAYPCENGSCPRILNFSNPGVANGGQATGTADDSNALGLAEAFPLMAANRAPAGTTPQPPSAPTFVQAQVSGLNVTLSWQPPASGAVTGYRGRLGTTPGAADLANQPLGLARSIQFSLGPGIYYVRIYAENAAGIGSASNELQLNLAPIGLSGPPRTLASSVSGSTVTLAWQPPAGGGAPQDYLLEAGSAPGAANLVAGVVVFTTSVSFPDIPPGRYYVRLRARNSAGVSAPSNEAVVDVGGCTLPPPPQNLRFSKQGFDVALFWDGVPVPGAVYVIEAGSAPGAANLVNQSVGVATAVSARVAAGSYFVRVRAATGCGVGAASAEMAIPVP